MLEKCPKVDDQPVFYCGAYYHGWLNATNPVPLDGTVDRTMCFSDITTCNCKKSIAKQIQMRNCGNYFVYKLNDLSDICRRDLANNARYCGMRGKSIFCLLAILQLGFLGGGVKPSLLNSSKKLTIHDCTTLQDDLQDGTA